MSTQINLKLSDKMYKISKKYSDENGFTNIQEFIRECIREKLFYNEKISGLLTTIASEKSLIKNWNQKKEDKAWKHIQKET
jgi:hypothetical protein